MLSIPEPKNLWKSFVLQRHISNTELNGYIYLSTDKLINLSEEKRKGLVPVLFRAKPYACYLERSKIYRNKDKGRDVISELTETELRFYYLFAKKLTLSEIAKTIAENNGCDVDIVFKDLYRFFFRMTAQHVCFATIPSN